MSLYTFPPSLKMELSCVLESKSSDNCSLINVLVTIVGWGTAFALIGYWLFTTEGNWLWKCEYWWDFNENDGDLSPSDRGDNVNVVEGDNDEQKMPYNKHGRNLVI